jgi:two-component system, NarL family, sensor kinase
VPAHRSVSGVPAADREAAPPWRRLVDGGDPGGRSGARRRPPSVRRVLARFVAANLAVAALLLAGSVWAGNRAARSESLADASETTDLLAGLLVEPNLSDGVLTGDPQAVAALDDVVDSELRRADVVRIKIWDPNSQIVYSDEPRLIGRRFPLGERKQAILRNGGTLAELTSLHEDEHLFERPQAERLLEVYRQITTPGGDRLLLETYFDYRQVTSRQVGIWLSFAPISASVLLAMLLVQLPLAKRLIRQVRQGDEERLRLHARAESASTEERRRIAGSLHDGVVQDLSAAPLFMSRAADRLGDRPGADAEDREAAEGLRLATTAVRRSVASLRSLLIEIYPPHLARAGLPPALADLAARVQSHGIRTRLDIPDDLDLPPAVEGLLFRVAQEALLNAAKHAHAGTVELTLSQEQDSVTMGIRDDGTGFDLSEAPAGTGTGHFGIRVLTDLAEAAGATLDLATAPGRGTALRLQVPVRT